ncbi:MAG TPA: histidine phosphatase family protein [Sediminibacterium sp.]|nr:histidine phosphatase family protein [Sediminibacterium sp.]
MKQLLIIRHAKSSWAQLGQVDFDRPLSDRGHQDAPAMAKRLLQRGIHLHLCVSSPANRALTTARYFAASQQMPESQLLQVPELYHPAPAIFYRVILAIPDPCDTVAVFSHNPGITSFVNELTKTRIDNMPTCGIFAVQCDIKHWSEFKQASSAREFWFFDAPKLA